MAAAGTMEDGFPSVAGVTVFMSYYNQGAASTVMTRTVNIFPTSYAFFIMDCVTKGCTGGGYDLTSAVKSMVKSRKKLKKGTLMCCGKVEGSSEDHARIDYEILIEYSGRSKNGGPKK